MIGVIAASASMSRYTCDATCGSNVHIVSSFGLNRALRALYALAFFVHPGGVVLIVLPDAAIEVASQAADDGLVADVGGAEPAGREAAQMIRRLDQHDALAHALGLDRRDDAGRRAAVDDDVDRFGGDRAGPRPASDCQQRQKCNEDAISYA